VAATVVDVASAIETLERSSAVATIKSSAAPKKIRTGRIAR
jgi:hypothetical protein